MGPRIGIHATIRRQIRVQWPAGNHDGRCNPGSARNLLEFARKRVLAAMKLNIKRLFARSMTEDPILSSHSVRHRPARRRRRLTFVMLAGVLAIVGTLAAGYYFAMRPVTLRIAVGPANSDDLKVVQTLAQAFNNQATQPGPSAPDADRRRQRKRAGAGRRQGRSRHHPRRSRSAEECASGGDAAQECRGAVGAAGRQGSRARRPRRRSPRSRSSPDTASAWSAAPRPTSIC